MPRVTLTISEQTLKQINQAAAANRLSRSTLLQKASSQYRDTQKLKKEANNRRQRMTQTVTTLWSWRGLNLGVCFY